MAKFDDLVARLKMTPPEHIVLDHFDQGPKYNTLYFHHLDDGIYAQKGDLVVKISEKQVSELLLKIQ